MSNYADGVVFEVRPAKQFHATSQTITLQMSHDGVDVRDKARIPGISVFTNDLKIRTFLTTNSEDKKMYNGSTPLDITLSPRVPFFRVMKGEWAGDSVKQFRVFMQTHPNVADYNNPKEFDKIAGVPTGAKANAKFVFEEKADTVENEIKDAEETMLISQLLVSNRSNREALASFLYYLGENPSESASASDMYVSLVKSTTPIDGKHRKAFMSAYIHGDLAPEEVKNTVVANKALADRVITFTNGIYMYGTEKIGTNLDHVVMWLKNNTSASSAIKRALNLDEQGQEKPKAQEVQKQSSEPKKEAPKKASESPYTEEEFKALTQLFTAAGVKNPRKIGNSPFATENECTLTAMLLSLNAKLDRTQGVKVTPEIVRHFAERGEEITLDFLLAQQNKVKRTPQEVAAATVNED